MRAIGIRPGLLISLCLLVSSGLAGPARATDAPGHVPWIFDAEVDAAVRDERILDAFGRQVTILADHVRATEVPTRDRVRALIATGYLAHRGGHQRLATELLGHAVDAAERVLGSDDVDVARALIPLGIAFRFTWRRAEADSLYRRAADVLAGSPDPVLRGCLTHAEADFLRHLSYDGALARFARAADELRAATRDPATGDAATRDAGTGEGYLLADVLTWWGWNLCRSGRTADALPLLAEAEAILVDAGMAGHSRRATILDLRADSLTVAGDLDGAIALLEDASPMFHRGRRGLFPGPSSRLIPPVADEALAVLFAARGEDGRAFAALQRFDGFLSEPDVLLGRWADREPAEAARHDSLGRLLLDRIDRVPDVLDDEADWEALVAMLEARARVWTMERAYLDRHRVEVMTPDALAHTLTPGSAFVATVGRWSGGDKRHPTATTVHQRAAFVLRSDGTLSVRHARSASGREAALAYREIAAAPERAMLRAGAWNTRIPADPALTRVIRAATEGWVDSLLVDLDGVRRVLWAGGGVLDPGLLVDADGRRLGEHLVISSVPSAQSIPLLAGTPLAPVEGRTLVVAAVPSSPVDVSGETVVRESWFFDVDVVSETLTIPASLPALARESGSVAANGAGADRLVDEPGTVDTLRAWSGRGRLAGYGLVHVIGHTHADPDPESCGVLLPGPDGEAVVMTPERIRYGWRLGDPVVVLSGCRTGQSSGYAWGEFAGRSSYFAAGARAIVASMWPVDDRATSTLMGRLHRNLGQGMGPTDALLEAKRWTSSLTDDTGGRPFEHPVYWAAFRLIGGPDPAPAPAR